MAAPSPGRSPGGSAQAPELLLSRHRPAWGGRSCPHSTDAPLSPRTWIPCSLSQTASETRGGWCGELGADPRKAGEAEEPQAGGSVGLAVESREPALREEQHHCLPAHEADPPNASPKTIKLFPLPLLESIKLEEEPNRS